MSRILSYIVNRVLFGDKLKREDGDRIIPAFEQVSHSLVYRILMPFMPYYMRVPGDRAFLKAVKAIDDVVFPVVRKAMADPDDNVDIISVLCRSVDENGDSAHREADPRRPGQRVRRVVGDHRDGPHLAVAAAGRAPRGQGQAPGGDRRGGGRRAGRPRALPHLVYTRMVLQETMRLYPAGWLLPRVVMEDAEIGGVRIKAGSTVMITPYATQRLEEFWERPDEFDPERFAPDRAEREERRHRYAYFPFGGGPHQCLGEHLFYVEAPLVVATILSRFRMSVRTPGPFTTAWAASLRPQGRVELNVSCPAADQDESPL